MENNNNQWGPLDNLGKEYALFVCMMRPRTSTSLLIKIPAHVGPDDLVEWAGDEFDWGFIPMEVKLRPENFLDTYCPSKC
jgi:hypothetical protein